MKISHKEHSLKIKAHKDMATRTQLSYAGDRGALICEKSHLSMYIFRVRDILGSLTQSHATDFTLKFLPGSALSRIRTRVESWFHTASTYPGCVSQNFFTNKSRMKKKASSRNEQMRMRMQGLENVHRKALSRNGDSKIGTTSRLLLRRILSCCH